MDILDLQPLFKYKDFDSLYQRLAETIINGRRHKHYNHTVEVADMNYSFMTGDGQEEVIIKYKENEKDEAKEQRQRLYNSLTQYISSKVLHQFKPINRPDVVNERMERDVEDKSWISEIQERRNNFTVNGSLDKYLNDRFLDLLFYDPNAWLVAEIENTDPANRKPYVYAVEVYSKQAIDYEIESNLVQQLTILHQVTMIDEDGQHEQGEKYIIHANDRSIVAHQFISQNVNDIDFSQGEAVVFNQGEEDEKRFWVTRYETNSIVCPAIQVGYLRDPRTNWETFVSPLYPAEKLYEDIITTKSEYDLAKAIHGFIQKFVMAHDCDFDDGHGNICERGCLPNMEECPKCMGTGLAIHTTVQDVVVINAPQDKEEHIPLDQWVHYVEIPQHIIDKYREDLRELEVKVSEALFNKDVFTKHTFAETATEKVLDKESVNDVLYVAAEQKAALWKFFIQMIAIHTQNIEGLKLTYEHERDFRLETMEELVSYREKLVQAKAPNELIEKIDEVMARKLRIEPESIERQRVMSMFKPFNNMTENERLIALNSVPRNSEIFTQWIYHDRIFFDLLNEIPVFSELPPEDQKRLYQEKAREFLTEETQSPAQFTDIDEEE